MTRRITIRRLICEDLHYCCPWAFFEHYKDKDTSLIAARLGVTPRAIRYQRADVEEKQLRCENRQSCLRYKLL